MHVHLVFITKYRKRVLDGDAINRLRGLFSKVCTDFEAELVEIDGGDHHVHLLVKYPPKVAVSHLVNSLKGVSSRLLRQERPDLAARYSAAAVWDEQSILKACSGRPLTLPLVAAVRRPTF